MPPLQCHYCREPIGEGVHPYTMKIELFPRVEESTQFSESEMQVDLDEEIRRIVRKLHEMSPEEAELENDRVYARFNFVVCPGCRNALAEQLRNRDPTS